MWRCHWTPYIWFPFDVNSNIGPKQALLQDIRLRNLSELECDLSMSLKVKCESPIGLPIYGFLLMFNSNIGLNQAPQRDISLKNLGVSRSFKVKSTGAVGLPIYDFVSVSNSNYVSNLHRLEVIANRKIFSYLLSFGPNFDPPHIHPYPWAIFLKIESLHSWVQGKPLLKNEVHQFSIFCDMLLTDTHTQTHTHKAIATRKTAGTAENPAHQQTT